MIVLTLRASLGIPRLTMRRVSVSVSVRGLLGSYRGSCGGCAHVRDCAAGARERGRDRGHACHERDQPRGGVQTGAQ